MPTTKHERTKRDHEVAEEQAVYDETKAAAVREAAEEQLEETDDLLDEIDALMDEVLKGGTAEQFVREYVQKGGE